MKGLKKNQIFNLWWVIPLILFDFFYYYFVQRLIERNSEGLMIEIHFEAIIFLFLISLFSIGCVSLSDRLLSSIGFRNLSVKYLINIFLSFLLFIVVVMGVLLLFEQSRGPRPFSYLLNQSLIFLFLHLVVGNAAIAVSYFRNAKLLNENVLVLEKIKAEKDLKMLQQQMSPHFLFNNLNTLLSLIPIDQKKAIEFTRRLSAIFRHAADHTNSELIKMEVEMDFIINYMELISFRFGSSYKLNNEVDFSTIRNYLCIPLALQVLIENVIKHNIGNKKNPLIIDLRMDSKFLIVGNLLRAKIGSQSDRLGIGLNNLNQQYELVTGKNIEIIRSTKEFIVKLPLIKEIKDENISN